MSEIISQKNPKFKKWLSLLDSKGIKSEGLALVSGRRLVSELIQDHSDLIKEILLPPKTDFKNAIFQTFKLNSTLFNELDVLGTKSEIAVVQVPKISDWDFSQAASGLSLILALGDPSNLGAMLRSAHAFGVSRVILTKECSFAFLPKAIKSSSLSCFKIALFKTDSISSLDHANIYALDLNGTEISQFNWPKDFYLLLGEEGRGIPEELKVKRLRIKISSRLESLNATVAGSIALYDWSLHLKK